jgi:hypothetical protein
VFDPDEPLSRERLAVLFGVSPFCVDRWDAQGLPAAFGVRMGGPPEGPVAAWRSDPTAWHSSRRDTAKLLGTHVDTLTKKLPDGLEAAVVHRGPRGEPMVFDARVALRWKFASEGVLNAMVLDDLRACARVSAFALSQLSALVLVYRTEADPGKNGSDPVTPSRRQRAKTKRRP